MEVTTLVLSILGFIFGLMGFIAGLYAVVIQLGIERSTHRIEFRNPLDQINKDNLPSLDDDYPEDEEVAKYREEYSKELKEDFAFFNENEEDSEKPKYIRGL